MLPTENPWLSGARTSALLPLSLTSGDKPPPHPPDPPDSPSSSLSLSQYPPLTSSSSSKLSPSSHKLSPTAQKSAQGVEIREIPTNQTTEVASQQQIVTPTEKSPISQKPRSTSTVHEQYKIIPPKSSSPFKTNRASNLTIPSSPVPIPNLTTQTLSSLTSEPVDTVMLDQETNHVPSTLPLPSTSPSLPLNPPRMSSQNRPALPSQVRAPNLAEKIRIREDKSLQRLAPATIGENGRPRVLIPDAVFQKGAEIHKDFIACYFNGRPPPFKQVQNVLNHMWGKGKRVEIHNNPLTRSMLVRIPSDYLREKILEKGIWYVGDSMFHTAQWTSAHSSSTPPLDAIPIWAHLHGVPLDLRHQEGLSLVAGLVGEPKETDDFTKNLVSLTISHVKVAMDLTKPVPDLVEFTRQSGNVVEVMVTYPWLPPTCAHCKELGHISKNCLLLPPPVKKTASAQGEPPKPSEKATQDSPSTSSPGLEVTLDANASSAPAKVLLSMPSPQIILSKNPFPPIPISPTKVSLSPLFSKSPPYSSTPHIVGLPAPRPPNRPPIPKPSLKRSRSDPSFSSSPPKNPVQSLISSSVVVPFSPSQTFSVLHSEDSPTFGESLSLS